MAQPLPPTDPFYDVDFGVRAPTRLDNIRALARALMKKAGVRSKDGTLGNVGMPKWGGSANEKGSVPPRRTDISGPK